MKAKDLNPKKKNTQKLNEGFSGENIADVNNPSGIMQHTEVEIDLLGNPQVVHRARMTVEDSASSQNETTRNWNENESLSRGVSTEEQANKTVENKDHNSDITPNRYPNSHPDNYENRGNIKLDEK